MKHSKAFTANFKLWRNKPSFKLLSGEPDCSCYPDCKEVEYKIDVKSETLEVSFSLVQHCKTECEFSKQYFLTLL